MSSLIVNRTPDHVHYLCTDDDQVRLPRINIGNGVEAGVIRWTGIPDHVGRITLVIDRSPFGLHHSMLAADARALAHALLMAADEADEALAGVS